MKEKSISINNKCRRRVPSAHYHIVTTAIWGISYLLCSSSPIDAFCVVKSHTRSPITKLQYAAQHDDDDWSPAKNDEEPSLRSDLISDSTSRSRRSFLSRSLLQSLSLSSVITVPLRPQPTLAATNPITVPATTPDVLFPLGKVAFSLLPLAGTSTRRATVESTIIPDLMWTHDQIQGVVNVNVPVRQTVIRLSPSAGGGLWVHNPVAPTPQLIRMMRRLEDEYGPVRHIVLGTVALEHKATLGPFSQYFRGATVWLQPGQWAFPFDIPLEFAGVLQRGPLLRELPCENPTAAYRYDQSPPAWAHDIDYTILGPLVFKSTGAFSETAFFHKSSKTLLVTDAVVSVTKDPPPIIQEDPRAMLFHARDDISDIVTDDEETRRKGWRRMVQFGLVFFPSQITVTPLKQALDEAQRIDVAMRPLGEDAVPYNLYPWTWNPDNKDITNFEAISQNGALFCPPILTKLILDREPIATLEWVELVARKYPFERVIPCHLNNDVKATPEDFRRAFDVLRSDPSKGVIKNQRPLAEDLALLQKASDLLTKLGVVDVSKVCDGEPARSVGRFASK